MGEGERQMTLRRLLCLVGIDFLDRNDFDVGGDVVGTAEVEHLLGFPDAADVRAGEAAAPHDEAKRREREGLRGSTNQGEVAIAARQIDIGVDEITFTWRSSV